MHPQPIALAHPVAAPLSARDTVQASAPASAAGPAPRAAPGRRRWLRQALGLLAPAAAALGAAPGPARAQAGQRLPVLLAREWPADADPAGFLVSEKFDGVRALWDGRVLRSRSGTVLAAPAGWLRQLPGQPLDGELWLGRGRFEALVATVRRQQPDEAAWAAVRYQVFELPAADGTRFAERAEALQALSARARSPVWQAVLQRRVQERAELARWLDEVVAAGGEGLVLHRADAPLADGRGPWLWKHKPRHDAEATVLAVQPGHGRLAGRMGALRVRTDAGVELDLGSGFSDAERAAPPPPGSRISFSHQGFTAQGVPRFARYLRRAMAV